MSLYRDTAIVLRVHKLGEADRIVTALSRRHGKIRAAAKGVRKTTSRFGARLEPFAHVDLQAYTGRNGRSLDVVTQAQLIDAFSGPIACDYDRYTAGSAILEATDRLVPQEGEPALRLYLLLSGALRALAEGTREPTLVLDAFLLRAMVIAGWAPAVRECARCSAPGAHEAFSVAAGGAVCQRCRPHGATVPDPRTVWLLDALQRGRWEGIERLPDAVRRQASGLIAAHLQWHLERQLQSLPLVQRRALLPAHDSGSGPEPHVRQEAPEIVPPDGG